MSWRHGTQYGYEKKGCRCRPCSDAEAAHHRAWRDRARAENRPSYRRELATARALKETYRGTCADCRGPTSWHTKTGKPPEFCLDCHNRRREPPHGRVRYASAKWKCRCDECRAGHAAYMRGYMRERRKRAVA